MLVHIELIGQGECFSLILFDLMDSTQLVISKTKESTIPHPPALRLHPHDSILIFGCGYGTLTQDFMFVQVGH